jgi:hypothetical protein
VSFTNDVSDLLLLHDAEDPGRAVTDLLLRAE